MQIRQYLLAVFLLLGFIPLSIAAKLSDAEIFAIFDQANTADIETGQLGILKGDSDAVRELGKMVVRDHTAVRQMARDIAKDISLTPKLPQGDKGGEAHKTVLKHLKVLSGKEFDKAYLLHEIEFHTNAINAIKNVLIPNTECVRFKELANKVLPGFEHHLSETRRVAKELGVL